MKISFVVFISIMIFTITLSSTQLDASDVEFVDADLAE